MSIEKKFPLYCKVVYNDLIYKVIGHDTNDKRDVHIQHVDGSSMWRSSETMTLYENASPTVCNKAQHFACIDYGVSDIRKLAKAFLVIGNNQTADILYGIANSISSSNATLQLLISKEISDNAKAIQKEERATLNAFMKDAVKNTEALNGQ